MSSIDREQAQDDDRLIRYLVGSLNDEQAEQLDELSIVDDAFAERLQDVENDLVDAYVRGELPSSIRTQFEAHYLSSPLRRDKVRFAEAWLTRQNRAESVQPARSLTTGGQQARRRAAWLLAAAAFVVLALAGYLLLERVRVQSLPSEPTRAATPPQPVPIPVAPPTPAAPSGSAAVAAPVVSLVLFPTTRGADEPPALAVPRGSATVGISVVLESDDFPRYEVILKDPGTDRTLWRSARLPSSRSGTDRIVAITFDAALLKSQRYVLELSGYRGSADAEIVSSYSFRALLQSQR